MIELLAIAREDGWAYVRTNDGIRLVRPPYTLGDLLPADEQSIEKVVLRAGFVDLRKEFDDWNSLIAFLNQQVVQSRLEQGKRVPEVGPDPQELLALAPTEQLVSFLNRIEVELLPNRAWEHAERILVAMLRLPSVSADEQLAKRARKLLQRIADEREAENQVRIKLALPESRIIAFDDQIRWLKTKKVNDPNGFHNWVKKFEKDIHEPPYALLCFRALCEVEGPGKGMEYLPVMAEHACNEPPPFQFDVVLAQFISIAGRIFWQALGDTMEKKMSLGARTAVVKALQNNGHGAIQMHSDSVFLQETVVIEVIANTRIHGSKGIRPVITDIDRTDHWHSNMAPLGERVYNYSQEEVESMQRELRESQV